MKIVIRIYYKYDHIACFSFLLPLCKGELNIYKNERIAKKYISLCEYELEYVNVNHCNSWNLLKQWV